MKKVLGIVISFALLVVLSSCGSSSEENTSHEAMKEDIVSTENREASYEEIKEKTVSAIENAHSVEFETERLIDINTVGNEEIMEDYCYSKEILGTNKTYNEIYSIENGEEYEFVSFTEPNGEYINVYFNVSDTWMKQSTDKKELIDVDAGNDGFLFVAEYIKKLEIDEILKEKNYGEDYYIILGEIESNGLNEIIDSFVSEEQLEALKSENDVLKNVDVSRIYDDLEPVKIKLVVNKKTFLPTEFSMDMKEMANSLIDNMMELTGNRKGLITIEEAVINKKNIIFNSFDNFIIPDEAKAAQELSAE